jgi:hypothetical protein
LRKANINFVMSVRMHETTRLPLEHTHEIAYLRIFRKSLEKIQILVKSDKNNGYSTMDSFVHLRYSA